MSKGTRGLNTVKEAQRFFLAQDPLNVSHFTPGRGDTTPIFTVVKPSFTMETANFRDIDDYISAFPPEVREKLTAIRETALLAAPDATEAIRYNMPAILQNGYLLYFAAFKKHISLFPAPPATVDFFDEVAPYLKNKSTIQIPLKQEFPLELVTKLVRYRLAVNV